jgi:class 3 adenylate cyclase
MNLERFNELLLASVGVALAIVDPEDLRILFHNPRLAEWFPDAQCGVLLTEILPALDLERMQTRLGRGRPYVLETRVTVGRREVAVALEVRSYDHDGRPVLIVECQNVSRIRELEYMIESYSKMVEKQNRTLQREKERAEKLLLNIMPKKVFEEIQSFGVAAPQRFDEASVLMLDFIDFTERAESQDPASLVAELNDIFTAFDQIVEQFGCERIKTMGDAYMAVSGVPESNVDHAHNIAKVALLLVHYLERRNASHPHHWLCRIGIHTGPVIGSIVGVQKYVYDIFGPAVNMAARMEALSAPMEITLSEDMHDVLASQFRMTDRGIREVKGVGARRIYTLHGEASGTRRVGPVARAGKAR